MMVMATTSGMLLFSLAYCCVLFKVVNAASPVLLIPGLSGSQLETKVTSDTKCHTDWTSLWVNAKRGASLPDCTLDELTLVYNTTTGGYSSNTSGVEIRVPGFGETKTVEYLTTEDIPMADYMNELVEYFVERGYVRNKTIRAAPYDWRLSANELLEQGYYSKLQSLVEEMYSIGNGGVTIVVHSMGGPVSLYFLTKVVSQEWKDHYIHAYIPLSPAYAGAFGIMGSILFGDSSIKTLTRGKDSKETSRSFASTVWLLGSPSIWGDTPILSTPDRNYTANDYKIIFDAVEYKNGYQMYSGVADINKGYPAPNVPVHCFYGIDVPTPEALVFLSDNINSVSSTKMGPGDGTVNLRSLEVCLKWEKEQKYMFSSKQFSGVKHSEMVKNATVLQAIAEIVIAT